MRVIRLLAPLLLVPLPLAAAEPAPPDLAQIEASLKSRPDDPQLHARKCQALFARGQEQQALDHAAVALAKFQAAGDDQDGFDLGSFQAGQRKIVVRFNMSPSERAKMRDGIVRPYSFKVYSTDQPPRLRRVLDFELAYIDGQLLTAALGETTDDVHGNFGILDTQADFAAVKALVLKVLEP